MNFARFLMFLALTVWLGALIFFAVVAQVSFSGLPSAHLAGLVVRNSLIALHWMGMVSGVVFLASSLIESRVERGRWSVFRGSHLVVVIMLVLTAISQFHLIPRMDSLRLAAGEINQLPPNDALRVQFDHLHTWSTRIEGAVLVLGLIVLYVTTRRLAAGRP
jgi:uncharacterized BrkB/YihY/UPF0761 family membrane protein